MAYKKITEVNSAEELNSSDSLLVISDGELKQLPSSKANLGGGKHKMGDVVCCADYNTGRLKVIAKEEYEANPSAYNPIGLVADPAKRTFLYCELLDKEFAQISAIENYLKGYSSFDNGEETFERIKGLVGSEHAEEFPVFYTLRNNTKASDTIFYLNNNESYVPSLHEWEKVYNPLCQAFYDDPINLTGDCGSLMDRLIARKKGIAIETTNFFPGGASVFYTTLSTVSVVDNIDRDASKHFSLFNAGGLETNWAIGGTTETHSPIFGIYTEDEE